MGGNACESQKSGKERAAPRHPMAASMYNSNSRALSANVAVSNENPTTFSVVTTGKTNAGTAAESGRRGRV